MRSIKIVKAVAYAFNTQLAGMVETSNRSVRLPSTVGWHDINIKPHPSLVSSSKVRTITVLLLLHSSSSRLMICIFAVVISFSALHLPTIDNISSVLVSDLIRRSRLPRTLRRT